VISTKNFGVDHRACVVAHIGMCTGMALTKGTIIPIRARISHDREPEEDTTAFTMKGLFTTAFTMFDFITNTSGVGSHLRQMRLCG
jgi:hypothetical protein